MQPRLQTRPSVRVDDVTNRTVGNGAASHIAFGDPARIVSPSEAPVLRQEIAALGFTKNVFGLDSKSLADPNVIEELCRRYSRSLLRHPDDQVVDT
jgi:hypothetical protein